jgi:hypothetical protein
MKPRRIEPRWAIIFGFIAAPLCAFNAALGASLSGFKPGLFWMVVLHDCFSFPILTCPRALMTAWLLEVWNGGQHRRARLLAGFFGLLSIAFWTWSEIPLDSPEVIGGLLLPFLWSIGFFVFTLFARPPKI